MNPLYKLATIVFPERCPYCGCLIEPERIACPSCFETLRQKHIPLELRSLGIQMRIILRLRRQGQTYDHPFEVL